MKCAECGWKYPARILSPVVMGNVDGSGLKQTGYVCGICALDITNKLHGIKRTEFTGEQAESNRLDAIDWRERHPEQAPRGEKN